MKFLSAVLLYCVRYTTVYAGQCKLPDCLIDFKKIVNVGSMYRDFLVNLVCVSPGINFMIMTVVGQYF